MGDNNHWISALPALRNRRIAQRLLLYILVFSSFVTLVSTSVQLFSDYQRDVDLIETRLEQIESGYLASISASLWNLDNKQLELLMDGILHLPDIRLVEIYELTDQFSDPLHIARGVKQTTRQLGREYAITYPVLGEERKIGTLFVQASLDNVYDRLWDRVILIFFSQGIKTFLVSLFILYIFYQLVTRHLSDLASFVNTIEPGKLQTALRLNRKPLKKPDELDEVVGAFNDTTYKLHKAYEELRAANDQLILDIAARKKAEQEVIHLNQVLELRVQQRTAELEAANRELDSFCYSVSHDLRAPLRRIEGFRRILHDNYHQVIDDQGAHYLARIEAGTREMTEMINSFLRLSRSTQGEMNIARHNLSDKVNAILKRLREQAPERQVELHIASKVYGEVDSRFIDVLLTNLLENAWKYSLEKPVIEIDFGVLSENNERVYYIADKGVGFNMQFADRLFSPFQRLHSATEYEGAGIGLATVQRIIARHGGRIWATSTPGEGATFYFTLWSRNSDNGNGNHSISGRQS